MQIARQGKEAEPALLLALVVKGASIVDPKLIFALHATLASLAEKERRYVHLPVSPVLTLESVRKRAKSARQGRTREPGLLSVRFAILGLSAVIELQRVRSVT